MFPKVINESDPWDRPGAQNDSKPKKILYSHHFCMVLGSLMLVLSAWTFFPPPCFLVPSARLGKFLDGQQCHYVPIAGEEEG